MREIKIEPFNKLTRTTCIILWEKKQNHQKYQIHRSQRLKETEKNESILMDFVKYAIQQRIDRNNILNRLRCTKQIIFLVFFFRKKHIKWYVTRTERINTAHCSVIKLQIIQLLHWKKIVVFMFSELCLGFETVFVDFTRKNTQRCAVHDTLCIYSTISYVEKNWF